MAVEDCKDLWDLEMALAVLGSETVDGVLWSEAVKWLMLYGPPELRTLLAAASAASLAQSFPGVRVKGHGDSGQTYYALDDLAEALGLPAEAAVERLLELQLAFGVELLVDGYQVHKVN